MRSKQNRAAGKVVPEAHRNFPLRFGCLKGKGRTYFEKELKCFSPIGLGYSKDEILNLCSSRSFLGNVVGLEMASWRMFGVQSHPVVLGSSATLAVLPNAPKLNLSW
jgi:penicillin-binding protein 1C